MRKKVMVLPSYIASPTLCDLVLSVVMWVLLEPLLHLSVQKTNIKVLGKEKQEFMPTNKIIVKWVVQTNRKHASYVGWTHKLQPEMELANQVGCTRWTRVHITRFGSSIPGSHGVATF